VLKLAFVDGLSVRAISRRLQMARKTVRRILDRDGSKLLSRALVDGVGGEFGPAV
jgi:hypothetical protein